ncbi:long-chain-fatty-acid--CoA ligase [Nostoc linckia FACHB-104]|nr:long-chain-fatty-acid--CoA ligase [Nostoc linckia FACHB-104]
MSLGDCVINASNLYSDKIAILFEDQAWNYQDLNEITDKIAASLMKMGVSQGDRIAIHLSNCPEIVFCYYACFKIGAIAVPLNNRLKAPELEYILNHCQAKICISQGDLFGEIQAIQDNLRSVEAYIILRNNSIAANVHNFEELLQQYREEIEFPKLDASAIAAILYTSGTTARPKGVTHTHKSLLITAAYHSQQTNLSNADISGVMLPLCHIFGFALQMIASLSVGATLVIIPRFEPGLVLQNLQQHGVTKLYGLPVMYNALVNYPEVAAYRLDSLQLCFAGGDAVPATLQQRFTQMFGVEILEGCGMTEVIPYSMNPNDAKRLGSIGKATEGMMLRIVNDKGEDVPQGEIGEIIVKSEAMMLGYWNQPEATAAVLKDGWLYTGDLAWMDADNYYWFVSRKKEIIVRGGSNISPLEVEAVLYQHPSVKEAAVIGVPNANWGEIVQAFVVMKSGYAISKIELKEFMSDRIAAYKVPENIAFLPELPKGLTGKIHRKTLRDWATATLPVYSNTVQLRINCRLG